MGHRSPLRPWKRRVLSVLTIIAGGYASLCVVAWLVQERMIFPRQYAGRPATPGPTRSGVEQVWITAEDGSRVEAWFIPGRGRSKDSPGPAVIFGHGNAELIDHALHYADMYSAWGVSTLLPEFRGYGRSGGAPSQDAIVADFSRYHDWLAARPEVDRARIVFHGKSIGGGVAAALAAERAPAALILESTFASVSSMTLRFGLPPFLCRYPFRTDRVLPTLDRPILIMHGTQDEIIPAAHGRRLHELAPTSRYLELPGGHNDFPTDWAAYERAILEFLTAGNLVGQIGS